MNDRLLSINEVIELVGCGKSTLHKWVKANRFPKGIKINGLRRWFECIVLTFIRTGINPDFTPPSSGGAKPSPKRVRLAKHVKPKDHSK